MELQGSCRCGAIKFSCLSHTPVPFMACYCSICRKVAGSGGYGINILAQSNSFKVQYPGGGTYSGTGSNFPIITTTTSSNDADKYFGVYRVMMPGESGGVLQPSTNARVFCKICSSMLWCKDPTWDEWIYPFASAIDTALPKAKKMVHMMTGSKAGWVEVKKLSDEDEKYEEYPELSIEEWHKKNGCYVD